MNNQGTTDTSKVPEGAFRRGACHAAHWLYEQARDMAKEGKTAKFISDHISDLEQVLMDWRNGHIKEPIGNPWEWGQAPLAKYISEHEDEW
jgi:hypothetical protein